MFFTPKMSVSVSRFDFENLEAGIWAELFKGEKAPNKAWFKRKAHHQLVYMLVCAMQKSDSSEPKHDPTEAELLAFTDAIKAMPKVPGRRPVVICRATMARTFVVQMTDDEMTNFDGFMAAIKKVAPDFDQEKDKGWQHWTLIRSAFWNHQSVHVVM